MGIDDARKAFNKRLDDFGEDAMKKIRAQREVNAATSSSDRIGVRDRLNMMKDDNPRWNSDLERRRLGAGGAEGASGGVEEAGSTLARRIPPSSGYIGSKGPPPPPPVRRTTSTSSARGYAPTRSPAPAAVSPSTSARGAAPPPPPPRMANENGTANPPPPYNPNIGEHAQEDYYDAQHSSAPHQQVTASWPVHSAGHIEFSKFTHDDKVAFFGLLDQYFDQKQRSVR